jgi:hypothetical protein
MHKNRFYCFLWLERLTNANKETTKEITADKTKCSSRQAFNKKLKIYKY